MRTVIELILLSLSSPSSLTFSLTHTHTKASVMHIEKLWPICITFLFSAGVVPHWNNMWCEWFLGGHWDRTGRERRGSWWLCGTDPSLWSSPDCLRRHGAVSCPLSLKHATTIPNSSKCSSAERSYFGPVDALWEFYSKSWGMERAPLWLGEMSFARAAALTACVLCFLTL